MVVLMSHHEFSVHIDWDVVGCNERRLLTYLMIHHWCRNGCEGRQCWVESDSTRENISQECAFSSVISPPQLQ